MKHRNSKARRRAGMSLWIAALALAGLGPGVARAQEAAPPSKAPAAATLPDTVDQTAEKVVAAHAAKDRDTIAALAARLRPDAWLVAEELLQGGKAEEAAAFAAAAVRPGTEKLPEYVAARRSAKQGEDLRARVAELRQAVTRRDFAAVVAGTDAHVAGASGVFGAYLLRLRGLALAGLNRAADAEAALRASIAVSDPLGWVGNESACRESLAQSAQRRGDRAASLAELRTIAGIEGRRSNLPRQAEILTQISTQLREAGDVMKAFEVAGEALRIAKQTGDLDVHRSAASAYCASACDIEAFAKAIEEGELALATCDEQTHPARVLNLVFAVGSAHAFGGDRTRAVALLDRARALAEAYPAPDFAAAADMNAAAILTERGDETGALDLLHRAVRLSERASERTRGSALMLLGKSYDRLRKPEQALEYARQALPLLERSGNRHLEGLVRLDIARLLRAVGRPAEGTPFLERALEALTEIGDPSALAIAWGDLAEIRFDAGDIEGGAAASAQALRLARASGDPASIALQTMNQAVTLRYSGRLEAAAEEAAKALRLAEQLGDQGLAIRSLQVTASVLIRQERWAEALETANDMNRRLRGIGTRAADDLAAGMREEYLRSWRSGVTAACRLGDPKALLGFIESERAASFGASLAARDRLARVAVPQELREREIAARNREADAAAALARARGSGKRAAIAEARATHEAALAELLVVVAQIQRDCRIAADVAYPVPVDLAELRGALRPEEVVVLFHLQPGATCALVVTPEQARIVMLGTTKDLVAASEELRASDPAADTSAAAENLRKRLIAPLGLEARSTRVLVSAADQLSYVPFAVLIPDREVVSIPSATTYTILRRESPAKGTKILALGDPDYAAAAGGVALRSGAKLARIPHTATEARAVGDVVLLGKDATEGAFRDALAKEPRWRAVHLACHGLVDTAEPSLSALALTPSPQDDGLLRAVDMFGIRCSADLVVLSACETARGRVFTSEGVVGLTRSFMFAGSPRVLVSLWKVDDAATAALMTKFYEGFRQGQGAARALRSAQEHVRSQEKWKHPAYWAAWTLWGLPD